MDSRGAARRVRFAWRPEARPRPADGGARRLVGLVIVGAVALGGCLGCGPRDSGSAVERPNVVLITVDALRADHVAWSEAPDSLTPGLGRLATDSAVFRQAVSAFQCTTPSMPSLMTGRFPSFEGIEKWRSDTWYGFADLAAADEVGTRGLTRNVVTLAEILSDHGYLTAGFHTNPNLSKANRFDQGFAHYEQFHDFLQQAQRRRSHSLEGRYPPADVVADAVTRWLATRPVRPFLLWIHIMDPHSPYLPADECRPEAPGPLRDLEVNEALYHLLYSVRGATAAAADYRSAASLGLTTDVLIERAHELYRAEVRCSDRAVARIVDALGAAGELDKSVLVVTADHGEEFGDHGHIFHERRQPGAEELLRVPLLMRPPGGYEGGVRIDELVRTVDITPTILDLVGIRSPAAGFDGRSLGPLLAGRPDQPRTAFVSMIDYGVVRDATWKYRVDKQTGAEHLFRIAADPLERADGAALHPELVVRMRNRWQAFAAHVRGRGRGIAAGSPAAVPGTSAAAGAAVQE